MLRRLVLIFLVGVILGSLGSWKLVSSYKDTKYQNIISSAKEEADKKFKEVSKEMKEIERSHTKLAQDLEIENVEANKLLDETLADNRRLTRELDGLRDPFAKPSRGCSMSTDANSPSNPDDGATSGRLSDEASEFLLAFARGADAAASYAATCHNWARELNGGK